MLHCHRHSRDEGVGAASVVLDVIYQCVDSGKHFRSGLLCRAVEGVDLHAGCRVGGVADSGPGGDVSAHPMLRGEQGHQLHIRCFVEDVDGRFQGVVDSGGIGDKSDPFPFQGLEARFAQHLHSRFHPVISCLLGAAHPRDKGDNQYKEGISHSHAGVYFFFPNSGDTFIR